MPQDKRRARSFRVENNLSAGVVGEAIALSTSNTRQNGLSEGSNLMPRVTAGGAGGRPMTFKTAIAPDHNDYNLQSFAIDFGGNRQYCVCAGFRKVDGALSVFVWNTPRDQSASFIAIRNNTIELDGFTHAADPTLLEFVQFGNQIQVRHPDLPIHILEFNNGAFDFYRMNIVRMRYFTDTGADVQQRYPGLVWGRSTRQW